VTVVSSPLSYTVANTRRQTNCKHRSESLLCHAHCTGSWPTHGRRLRGFKPAQYFCSA